jgi:hypothetical protein
MKSFTPVIVLAAIISFTTILSGCGKSTPDVNKPIEAVEGKWIIARIQQRIYYGGVFNKDTILPSKSRGENAIYLEPTKVFKYNFNTTIIDTGTYNYVGSDSIVAVTSTKTYRWKMLTLTDLLFTTKSTSTNDPAFPGATVETYHTFIR